MFYKKFKQYIISFEQIIKEKHRFFKWSEECEVAFNKVKLEFGNEKVLVPFNPKLPLVLAVDASPYGIGAVLSPVPRWYRTRDSVCVKFVNRNTKEVCTN